MVGIEQLKRRLKPVEAAAARRQGADTDINRLIDEHLRQMLETLEQGEEYDTAGDEDLVWLWTEIKKIWPPVAGRREPGGGTVGQCTRDSNRDIARQCETAGRPPVV